MQNIPFYKFVSSWPLWQFHIQGIFSGKFGSKSIWKWTILIFQTFIKSKGFLTLTLIFVVIVVSIHCRVIIVRVVRPLDRTLDITIFTWFRIFGLRFLSFIKWRHFVLYVPEFLNTIGILFQILTTIFKTMSPSSFEFEK